MWPESDFPLSHSCEVTQLESDRAGIQTEIFLETESSPEPDFSLPPTLPLSTPSPPSTAPAARPGLQGTPSLGQGVNKGKSDIAQTKEKLWLGHWGEVQGQSLLNCELVGGKERLVSPCLFLSQGRKSPPGVRDTLLPGRG